jgi:transcription antitermination factor NusG
MKENSWYIVRTRPNAENRAGEEIISLGQTVYVPQFRKEYRHHRHKRWTIRYFPLMRGYLFVMASAHWNRVLGCASVERILRTVEMREDAMPVEIDDIVIQDMRARQDAGEFDEMRLHGRMDAGAQLRVSEGPLAGLKGVATDIGDKNVVMMIEMFGREIRAKAPVDILRKAG